MKKFVKELNNLNALDVFSAVHHLPYSLWLDSADQKHENAKFSYIALYPKEIIETEGMQTRITTRDHQQIMLNEDPFKIVNDRLALSMGDIKTLPNYPEFQGGAAGLFGYDLARGLEDIHEQHKSEQNTPDMAIGIYDIVFAFNHERKESYLFITAKNQEEMVEKKRFIMKLIQNKDIQHNESQNFKPEWLSNFNKTEYKTTIKNVINHIKEGDIFQANIAHRFTANLPQEFCAFNQYKNLRSMNAAPYASFFNIGNIKISSASPESFLNIKDRIVTSKPIKGTAPRGKTRALDIMYRNMLENSEKDKAENIMIIDLLRNDLSKICVASSIDTIIINKIESFSNVHHLVSTIEGTLKKHKTATDALRACFPGGSVTGAPKIRAMQIIEKSERNRRGAYCGSIAYITPDNNMQANILIRSLIYKDQSVSIQVGGGITALSDPEDEYQETLDKALGILDSFNMPEQIPDKRPLDAKLQA